MYEIVTKKEFAPIRVEIETIINKVQEILRENDSYQTLQFYLIESGGRRLVTRIMYGNDDYDFNNNHVMNSNFSWKPTIRNTFFDAFEQEIKGTIFTAVENTTSVIKIKQDDKNNKKVIVGCDFSVFFYPDYDGSGYYKEQNYIREIRNVSRFNDAKLEWVIDNYEGIWNDEKEQHLKLKNNNQQNKHSFIRYQR